MLLVGLLIWNIEYSSRFIGFECVLMIRLVLDMVLVKFLCVCVCMCLIFSSSIMLRVMISMVRFMFNVWLCRLV